MKLSDIFKNNFLISFRIKKKNRSDGRSYDDIMDCLMSNMNPKSDETYHHTTSCYIIKTILDIDSISNNI